MSRRPQTAARRAPGLAMAELLVALLLLAIGSLSMLRMQAGLRLDEDRLRQHDEALRRAADDLEQLRGQDSRPEPVQRRPLPDALDGTLYLLDRELADGPAARLLGQTSRVGWTDRAGQPQSVEIGSLSARLDARLSAATRLARLDASGRSVGLGRPAPSARLPPGSQDLGDGRHAWRARPDATLIWVFDSASAAATLRCDKPVPAAGTTERLDAGSLGSCKLLSGLLLSGHVRFATDTDTVGEAQAEQPASPVMPLGLKLTLSTTGHPSPAWECVHDGPDGGTTGSTRTSIAYHCVIQPVAPASGGLPRWSGRLDLVPSGWLLADSGATAGATGRFRICRYSADQDGNGRIDAAEHPATHIAVTLPLAAQNFLVIRASARCPVDTGPWPWPDPVDDSTVAHQP